MVVVASDVVGSAEILSEEVCMRYPTGDLLGFGAAVETAIACLRSDSQKLRERARDECKKHFSVTTVANVLLSQLKSLG